SGEPAPLNVIPVPAITLAATPMLIASSVLIVVTGPAPPITAASAPPNVTPPSARVTVSRPKDEVAVAAPRLALKNTLPVPTLSARSLCSAPWLLIVALLVNVTSPGPVPVSIERSLLSVTAPLSRTASLVVVMTSGEPSPLNVIPVPAITLAPTPRLIASSVLIVVTGPAPPITAASAPPNVTPPSARVTVSRPKDEVAVAAPRFALKNTLPVPTLSARSLCSAPWLLIVALLVNVTSPGPVPVSIERSLLSVTAPL